MQPSDVLEIKTEAGVDHQGGAARTVDTRGYTPRGGSRRAGALVACVASLAWLTACGSMATPDDGNTGNDAADVTRDTATMPDGNRVDGATPDAFSPPDSTPRDVSARDDGTTVDVVTPPDDVPTAPDVVSPPDTGADDVPATPDDVPAPPDDVPTTPDVPVVDVPMAPDASTPDASMGSDAGSPPSCPEGPRTVLDTTYVPSTGGRVISVAAGGNLQQALDSAVPGDTISLAAGATFSGNFTIPVTTGNGWVIVRTSTPDAMLPPPGTRVTPANASLMARIVTPNANAALATQRGAHHFRFIGLELAPSSSSIPEVYSIVALGNGETMFSQLPHDLIFDRVWVHGTPTGAVRRGITINDASTAVIDSYINDIHEVGQDTQAIGSWNGAGPFKIVNNYLEAAGENVIFGGADPSIPNLVPSDIEIRGNHFFKPLSWRVGDPSYAGTHWSVKNHLEFKNAQRVVASDNYLENVWGDAQSGFAVLFTPRNQSGTCPWCVVRDIQFLRNVVNHAGNGLNVLGADGVHPSQQTVCITIAGNLILDISASRWSGDGRALQILSAAGLAGADSVTYEHNTGFSSTTLLTLDSPTPIHNFVYRNNLEENAAYGIISPGGLMQEAPGAIFTNNAIIGGMASGYPAGNFFPRNDAAVGWVNEAGGDYHLLTSSPYHALGTDGADLGADINALATAFAAQR